MVKFSSGMWWVGPHVSISWATEVVKSEAFEDRIRCVTVSLWVTPRKTCAYCDVQSTKRINHRGDTLNTPTITMECSSPIPDTLFLDAYHWMAQQPTLTGPDYEVFPDVDIDKLVGLFASYRLKDRLKTI